MTNYKYYCIECDRGFFNIDDMIKHSKSVNHTTRGDMS